MNRIAIPLASLALAALIAPSLAAQPAPEANEHAFRKTQCAQLHDDFLKQKAWLDAKPDLKSDDAKGKGHGKGNALGQGKEKESKEEKDLDKMLKDYEQRCGKLPADMAPTATDDGKSKDQGKEKDKAEWMQGKDGGKGGSTATAPTQPAPALSPRCADIHQKMKDALARKGMCGKDKKCKQTEEFGYDQQRNAFRNFQCGEVPADALPKKG